MQETTAKRPNIAKTFHKIILALGCALLGTGLVFLLLLLFAIKEDGAIYFIFFTVICFALGIIYLILGAVLISKDIKAAKRRTNG